MLQKPVYTGCELFLEKCRSKFLQKVTWPDDLSELQVSVMRDGDEPHVDSRAIKEDFLAIH